MNTITSFTFHENHNVRIIKLDNDDFLFHANDLCAVLKYVNPRDAIRRHVDVEDVVKHDTLTNGGKQKQNYVKEAGMWALVLGSETEQAKLVKRWVTSEVLPALRKTGRYETTKATDTRDYLTNNDMNNIKRLIWACSSNVSHGKAFENGIWHALRQVTGVPSPSKFEAKHLPVLADEFQRILNILEPYFEARRICEESLIKRVLRERADHIIINELLDQMITATNTAKSSIKKQISKTITSQACIDLKNRSVCEHKYA